jgi:hypothetical protein
MVRAAACQPLALRNGGTDAWSQSLGWSLAIAALSFIAHCGAATGQGASPPPAVLVAPVVSRQVTETGDFIGR